MTADRGTVVIRPAVADDLPHLAPVEDAADLLLVAVLGADPWPAPATPGEVRAEQPGFILIATTTDARDLVGFAHVLEVDGLAHLDQVSVHPEHGRRGHGRALVEAAKAETARRGYAEISLRTYADVPWNAPFYATCGFVETTPATPFHRHLVQVESDLGLERWGRREQMTAVLRGPRVTGDARPGSRLGDQQATADGAY